MHILSTVTKTKPPDCCIVSKGKLKNASPQHAAVMLASHSPFSNIGDINIAKADRNARVVNVSAIPLPRTTEPLGLHKQEE